MDLNRLEKKIRELGHRYRHLTEWAGEVLDGDRSAAVWAEKAKAFVPKGDVAALLARPPRLQTSYFASVQERFAEFAPHFEAGFFLQSSTTGWLLRRMFLFGEVMTPPRPDEAFVDLAPPPMREGQVLRARGCAVLAAFHLESLRSLGDSSGYLFSLGSGLYFLFLLNRGEPWQVDHVEQAFAVVEDLVRRRER